MPYLSRLAKLGGAKETSQYTYLAPTFSIPFTSAAFEDVITPLRDESYRANDAVVQGIQQGTRHTTWDITHNAYADIVGNWLRAMIGPDTVTAGVSTTLSASTLVGATSVSVAATIPAGSTIMIGTGATTEYAITGTPSGAGPYTIPITTPATGLVYAHASSQPVVSQTTHLFKQNRSFSTVWPTYSFTVDDGADQTGWPGCVCSELAVKIDPKGFATVSPKFTGMPSTTESTFSYAASNVPPIVGWAWTITQGGSASTRGVTMDLTLKRAVDALFLSTGQQGPRDVFPGAMEIDGTYKAVFENTTDLDAFQNNSQPITVHTLTQPLAAGGAVLAMTMSQPGWTTGKRDLAQPYVQADFSLTGINNTTDSGIAQVSLQNFVTASY